MARTKATNPKSGEDGRTKRKSTNPKRKSSNSNKGGSGLQYGKNGIGSKAPRKQLKNLIDTALVLLLFVRSEGIRKAQIC